MDAAKPTYTVLHKQSSGCYSLSITSNPDEEWREVRPTGPVQKWVPCHILFSLGGHSFFFFLTSIAALWLPSWLWI